MCQVTPNDKFVIHVLLLSDDYNTADKEQSFRPSSQDMMLIWDFTVGHRVAHLKLDLW